MTWRHAYLREQTGDTVGRYRPWSNNFQGALLERSLTSLQVYQVLQQPGVRPFFETRAAVLISDWPTSTFSYALIGHSFQCCGDSATRHGLFSQAHKQHKAQVCRLSISSLRKMAVKVRWKVSACLISLCFLSSSSGTALLEHRTCSHVPPKEDEVSEFAHWICPCEKMIETKTITFWSPQGSAMFLCCPPTHICFILGVDECHYLFAFYY